MAREDYRDRDRSRDRDRPRDDRRDDRRRDDRGRRDSRGADNNDRRNPRGVSRDHHRQARDRDRDRRADEDMNRDRRGADDRGGKPPSQGDASAPEKKAEVRLRPPQTSSFGTSSTTTLARSLTPHPSRRALTPTPTISHPLSPTQPLSLEELLKKRKEEADAKAKPTFMSKKEREEAALKRLADQRAAQAAKRDGAINGVDAGDWAREHRREEERKREAERRKQRDERAKEAELAQLKEAYMGGEKVKKKVAKASDRFKFKFDWEHTEDTSRDLNPLYDKKHDAALLFGRGLRAGVDRREQKSSNSAHQMNLVSRSRADAGDAMTKAEVRRWDSQRKDEDEAYERAEHRMASKHWSDKALGEMNERDWRIFREDFNITTKGGRLPLPMRSWEESTMPVDVKRAIEKVGYAKPSPIQMASIPIGLLKRDVIGIAETGSGKTCAFVVPMLAYIQELPPMTDEVAASGPYALVMAPTRELAQQIEEETVKFAQFMNYRVASVVCGQSIEEQGFKLRRGCEIVIGTPGRIIDVLERRYTVLQQCNYIVLDEADRMIDMGFEPQVNSVMDSMSADSLKPEEEAEKIDEQGLDADLGTKYRMTYMFSATMPPSVEKLARKYMRNPAVVNIGGAGKTSDLIKQIVQWTTNNQKPTQLELVLSQYPDTQAIIFVNTKRIVDHVSNLCHKMGYSVAAIHGGKSQDQREESLRGFKQGEYDILVATDVAGRGIDVKGIDLVVNYEMPLIIENYTHRIGRTGRAGRQGTAVSFLTAGDTDVMYELKELLTNSGNSVPGELANNQAAKVKPLRDAKGQKLSRNDFMGMQDIIH